MKYPVVVVETGQDYTEEIDRLDAVETLDEAKQAAREVGYTVIDKGAGGNCETTNAWNHEQVCHVVTVLPTQPAAPVPVTTSQLRSQLGGVA